jgi:GT2 family glycosyltransferase
VISAIVINWNGREYLEDCIAALEAQGPALAEIILVDNHSEDGSREFVVERFPAVKIIDTGENAGPARARNLGVEAATQEKCLLVDNDVVLQPGALAEMSRVLDQDEKIAMVQARSLLADRPELVHYDGGHVHYLGFLILHNWFRPLAEAKREDRDLGAGIALCFLTRRSIYMRVDGFYEPFFILYEDNEFSNRLRAAGYRIRLAANAHCLHGGGTAGLSRREEGGEYTARRVYLHSRNRWLMLFACMRWRTLVLTFPAQAVYALVYLIFAVMRGHFVAPFTGLAAALRGLPAARARQRSLARLRKSPDRDLFVAEAMTLNPGLADRGASGLFRRCMDSLFAAYWALMRSFLA